MLKQFKHLGLVLEEVAVYRWGTHFVSTSMDRELSAHWVYFFTFHLQNSSSECYLHPGSWGGEVVDISYSSWGWSLVDFSSYLIANHQPPQPLLKELGKKWRWHFKHTNCAYRHYLKGQSCRNMPPLVEIIFNQNSRPDTLNVKRRAMHYTTSFISQGEEHQGLWGQRLDESHLTWLQQLSHF